MFSAPRIPNHATRIALLAGLLAMLTAPVFAQKAIETIDAQAYGTSTQLGKNATVRLIVFQFSTQADTDTLTQAFKKGGNDGLRQGLAMDGTVGRIRNQGTAREV